MASIGMHQRQRSARNLLIDNDQQLQTNKQTNKQQTNKQTTKQTNNQTYHPSSTSPAYDDRSSHRNRTRTPARFDRLGRAPATELACQTTTCTPVWEEREFNVQHNHTTHKNNNNIIKKTHNNNTTTTHHSNDPVNHLQLLKVGRLRRNCAKSRFGVQRRAEAKFVVVN
jgi:hypothetical protein